MWEILAQTHDKPRQGQWGASRLRATQYEAARSENKSSCKLPHENREELCRLSKAGALQLYPYYCHDCPVRIQIGQIMFAMNDFNQTPSHPEWGRELVGVNNSHPVLNQGQNIQLSLSNVHQKNVFCFNRPFPAEPLTCSKANTGTIFLT